MKQKNIKLRFPKIKKDSSCAIFSCECCGNMCLINLNLIYSKISILCNSHQKWMVTEFIQGN